jgi:hypothetical protein
MKNLIGRGVWIHTSKLNYVYILPITLSVPVYTYVVFLNLYFTIYQQYS